VSYRWVTQDDPFLLDDFAWDNLNPYMAGLSAENSVNGDFPGSFL